MAGNEEELSYKKLVINNVLCYVSTARHSKKIDDIIHVCLAFYKDEDIIKGKDLLYGIINEKPKRRRHENRIMNELKDILDILSRCDEDGTELPRFVVDEYDGLPPSSGFELVANSITSLFKEIMNLREELQLLKNCRRNDIDYHQDHLIFKEDLLTIKGEIRKLNHKLIKQDIRRNSFMLGNLEIADQRINDDFGSVRENSIHREGSANNLGNCPELVPNSPNDCFARNESSPEEFLPLSPSAPPASQETWGLLARSFQDEGGSPSAPSFADIVQREEVQPISNDMPIKVVSAKKRPSVTELRSRNLDRDYQGDASAGNQSKLDSDGYQLVQRNKKRHKNVNGIVGSRKVNETVSIKSAIKKADIYLGNCDLSVTPESIKEYIYKEMDVTIDKCELLNSRNPNCKSFKITLNLKDRVKLLSAEVWPEDIVCRKFFSVRKSS